jgi:chitodextrinase
MRDPKIGTNVEGCTESTTKKNGEPKRGRVVDDNAGGSRNRLYEIEWDHGAWQLCERHEFLIDD